MKTRIITGVIALPIFLFLLYLGGWFRFGLVLALAVVGMWEYCQAINNKLETKMKIIPMILAAILVITVMKFYYQALMPTLAVCLILSFVIEIFSGRSDVYRGIASVFGLIYVPVMFGYMLLFDTVPKGMYYLWMVLIIAFVTDTAAYFTGRFFGKRKLCPRISPKKTVAGAIGGLFFAAAGMLIYGAVMMKFFSFNLPLYSYIILGLVGSVAAQCGDLTASLLKRKMEIKDYGKILPGHGGILDRFDSILFVTPIVYLFASLTCGYLI